MALTEEQESRIIEMAWEDRTPFEAIERLYGLPEKDVIKLMRKNLKQKPLKIGENGCQAERPNTPACALKVWIEAIVPRNTNTKVPTSSVE